MKLNQVSSGRRETKAGLQVKTGFWRLPSQIKEGPQMLIMLTRVLSSHILLWKRGKCLLSHTALKSILHGKNEN